MKIINIYNLGYREHIVTLSSDTTVEESFNLAKALKETFVRSKFYLVVENG